MTDIIKDVATVTTMDQKNLEKLSKIVEYCICDELAEARLNEQEVVEMDIGIGTLAIKVADGTIKYRFTPSSSLEKSLVDTIKNKTNPLSIALNQSLSNKLMEVYKELL